MSQRNLVLVFCGENQQTYSLTDYIKERKYLFMLPLKTDLKKVAN